MSRKRLSLGLSACFFHEDWERPIFKGKTLQYLEASLAEWVMSEGDLAFLIPALAKGASVSIKDQVDALDGLILQGGSDVSPKSYGEAPLKREWSGDYVRDQYEIALLKEFLAQSKPVLGICRGAQVLNVAFGGSLYQDIPSQLAKAGVHRNWDLYDRHFHKIKFEPGSQLAKLFPGAKAPMVNSIHHQAVKQLGKGLVVEAVSEGDGVIEALRAKSGPYAYAVQWHPEFHDAKLAPGLDCRPLLKDFLDAARRKKEG